MLTWSTTILGKIHIQQNKNEKIYKMDMDNSTWKSQLLSLGKKIFERGFIVATILRPGGYL
jgi:predicted metal-binding protein